MWLNYAKERFGYSSIEEKWGFVLYSINHPIIVLQDMYVQAEVRAIGNGSDLLSRLVEIGRENKCTHVWTQVWMNDRNANSTLQAALARDFKVAEAENNRIILLKKIEEA